MKRHKWDMAGSTEPAASASPLDAATLAAAQAAAAAATRAAAAPPADYIPHLMHSRAGIGTSTRAGIGSSGVTGINHPAYGGTGEVSAPQAPVHVDLPRVQVQLPEGYQAGKPLDEEIRKKIQASAAAVMQQLNQVG